MITEHHFPTMIYIKDFPDSEKLNKYLEDHIMRWSQKDKGVSKTNSGGWHSTTDMNKKEEYNPLTKELFNIDRCWKMIFSNHLKGGPPNHITKDFLSPLVTGLTRCCSQLAKNIA